MKYLIPGILLAAFLILLIKYGIRRVTILEYERGLLYTQGKFRKTLEAGQYWYTPLSTLIYKIDTRPRFVSITGQEVLSSDGVTLKVSLAAHYEITDPLAATHKAQNFQEALYLELQLALRDIVGSADIDAILQGRSEFSKKLMAITESKAQALGLKLLSVNLKDIMFPGKLKEVFARVVSARKEGLATLEKARGETAALRSLANAARMIEANPHLIQLRLIQSLGQSSGNSLVFGMSPSLSIPIGTKKAADEPVLPDKSAPADAPDSQ
ncbi:MAG: slipin family protein [Candidatus Contendobacter sp.]|nr:slipin family protein [Candidatus Contendobacter sp.]MDG4558943.1 slipin family protein [Candidatus Contendobacter sp.]